MEPNRNVTVNVTNRTMIRTILWVVTAILLYRFVGKITHVLILIFVSFFLALALNPVVSAMSRRLKIDSRARATAAAYLVVVLILGGFFTLITPPLVRQTRTFITNVPQIVDDFQHQNTSFARTAKRYNLDTKLTQAAKDFSSNYSNFGSTIFDTGKRVVEGLASAFAVLVMAFMMLVEGPSALDFIWGLTPAKNRERHKTIAHKIYRGVSGFVNGQVILAVIAGIFAFTALEIGNKITGAGVNALALAGIVSVFALIPLFGNPMSSSIVVLVCLINSLSLGLGMLAYFVVYFFLESHTFQPIIQSRLNDLTPLTVFVAAVIGVGFGGLLGAIVAIPTASAVKILLEDQLERRGYTVKKA